MDAKKAKITTASPALLLREAELQDRDEVAFVLSDGIYNGYDYLPGLFTRWLQDANHTMFVVEDTATKQIIGFEAIGCYDDGRTIVLQGLRVLPSHQGKGVAKFIATEIKKQVKLLYPGAERIRVVAQSNNQGPISYHKKQGFESVGLLGFNIGEVKKTPPFSLIRESLSDPASATTLKRVSHEDLWALITELSDEERSTIFYPESIICLDWVPMELSQFSLSYLASEQNALFTVLLSKETGKMVACAESLCSHKTNGLCACISVNCGGNEAHFKQLFKHMLCTSVFGCKYFFLSYDTRLRNSLTPLGEWVRDYRPAKIISEIEAEMADYIDFSADSIGSQQHIMEIRLAGQDVANMS